MKSIKILIAVVVLLVLFVWSGVKDSLSPTIRGEITMPIYTLGDGNYGKALAEEKKIVKFGPMFWGLYPGGLAFASVEDAKAYLAANAAEFNSLSKDWQVYRLSGDFLLDTRKEGDLSYLNKSLLVLAPAPSS